MMSPQRCAAIIKRDGQTVTLQREGAADLDLPAFVRDFTSQELGGSLIQGDRLVRIACAAPELAAASWPVPLKRGDTVVIKGQYTVVQTSRTLTVGDRDYEYVMQVRG